jgi:hypothetical protein
MNPNEIRSFAETAFAVFEKTNELAVAATAVDWRKLRREIDRAVTVCSLGIR